MKRRYSEHFVRSLEKSPERVQKAFDKQVRLLVENMRHPSLRAKKYDKSANVWQARVTGNWRFYFTIEGDTYNLTYIGPHPK